MDLKMAGDGLDHSCSEKYPETIRDPECSISRSVLFAHKNGSCPSTH